MNDIQMKLNKEYEKIDMMVTAYSNLRDTNNFKALLIDLFLLVISIIINATLFLDPSILLFLTIDQDLARLILGLSSIAIFIVSFISLRIDWKRKAEQYGQAAVVLSKIKLDYKILRGTNDEKLIIEKMQSVAEILHNLPIKIPEKHFLKLKALHKRKVALSEMVSKHPGASIFLLKIIVWLKSNYNLFKNLKD